MEEPLDQIPGSGELQRALDELPVIGIIRRCPIEHVTSVVEAVTSEEIRVIEITLDSADAAQQIDTVQRAFPDVLVGAGTVTDVTGMMAAVEAGAQFVISPIVSGGLIRLATQLNIAHIPGAATPTEIYRAATMGATTVKVFPASQLGGPAYLKALREPLEGVKLVPTGGIEIDNARAFLDAGAWAIGVGSALFAPTWLSEGDVDGIRTAASGLRRALQ